MKKTIFSILGGMFIGAIFGIFFYSSMSFFILHIKIGWLEGLPIEMKQTLLKDTLTFGITVGMFPGILLGLLSPRIPAGEISGLLSAFCAILCFVLVLGQHTEIIANSELFLKKLFFLSITGLLCAYGGPIGRRVSWMDILIKF